MKLIITLLAATVSLMACGSSYDGRGQEPQAVHPGDIVRQQKSAETS